MIKQFYLAHRWYIRDTTDSGQSVHGSYGNEMILHIPKALRLEPHRCSLVSYPGTK